MRDSARFPVSIRVCRCVCDVAVTAYCFRPVSPIYTFHVDLTDGPRHRVTRPKHSPHSQTLIHVPSQPPQIRRGAGTDSGQTPRTRGRPIVRDFGAVQGTPRSGAQWVTSPRRAAPVAPLRQRPMTSESDVTGAGWCSAVASPLNQRADPAAGGGQLVSTPRAARSGHTELPGTGEDEIGFRREDKWKEQQ